MKRLIIIITVLLFSTPSYSLLLSPNHFQWWIDYKTEGVRDSIYHCYNEHIDPDNYTGQEITDKLSALNQQLQSEGIWSALSFDFVQQGNSYCYMGSAYKTIVEDDCSTGLEYHFWFFFQNIQPNSDEVYPPPSPKIENTYDFQWWIDYKTEGVRNSAYHCYNEHIDPNNYTGQEITDKLNALNQQLQSDGIWSIMSHDYVKQEDSYCYMRSAYKKIVSDNCETGYDYHFWFFFQNVSTDSDGDGTPDKDDLDSQGIIDIGLGQPCSQQ